MIAEIICVGTELLLGNVVNTNGAYLARRCAALGLSCYYQSVVGDNGGRLKEAIETAVNRSDVLILSGGLGPTEDDLTKETAAAVMGRKLILDEKSKESIASYFKKRGMEATDNNWKQAMIPEGALILENHNGTAPGVIIPGEVPGNGGETEVPGKEAQGTEAPCGKEAQGTEAPRKESAGKFVHIVLLPGPPSELVPMFEESVVPYLSALEPGVIYSQTVKLCGVSESKVETQIQDLIDAQTNPTIATYAKMGEVHIRVTAAAADEKEAKKLTKPVVKELKNRFGYDIYSTEEDTTLEKAVVDLLMANALTVTCAESCTGGMLSARLINVPGISDSYKSGYVTYSNKAKRRILGVKKGTLQKHGAVSRQTAEEMAKGAAFVAKADVAVAVTGIAGPDGGTEEKPVGLVYIACSVKGKVTVREYHFSGNREKIRVSTTAAALTLMRRCMLEYFSKVTFGQ